MHIPDGLLSAPVAVACAALSIATVGAASSSVRLARGPRHVARTAVVGAFVFAVQMLNFPIAGGTSGHVVGGVLAAVLLGPASAVVAMTAVLFLQCVLFGDGGIVALGANVLNMAVVHPIVGFALFRLIAGRKGVADDDDSGPRRIAGAAFAAWAATVCTALLCAGELALSNVVDARVVLPAMVGIHVPIGIGEALVTAFALATAKRLMPRNRVGGPPLSPKSLVVFGLVPALSIALFVTPFACTWPDGLEAVVERLGIVPAHVRVSWLAPLSGYSIPGVPTTFQTTGIVAVVGTLFVFGMCLVLGRWLQPSRPAGGETTSSSSVRP